MEANRWHMIWAFQRYKLLLYEAKLCGEKRVWNDTNRLKCYDVNLTFELFYRYVSGRNIIHHGYIKRTVSYPPVSTCCLFLVPQCSAVQAQFKFYSNLLCYHSGWFDYSILLWNITVKCCSILVSVFFHSNLLDFTEISK